MPDPMQGENLKALLSFLMSKTKPGEQAYIQPSNYPNIPNDALTSAYLKNTPGALPGDIENTGYGVSGLSASAGQLGPDAVSQLMQMLTAQIRGMR